MKLSELDAVFVGCYNSGDQSYFRLESVEGAQGLLFVCPKCQGHSILVWLANPHNAPSVPDDAKPAPRWTFTGDTIDNVTLHPSIDLSKIDTEHPEHPGRCYWHGWVKNGDAQ